MSEFHKTSDSAPDGFFAAEEAGLRWLGEAGAIPVVRVLGASESGLVLERIETARPSPGDARRFGRRLAALHDAGAPAFGYAPSPKAWFGPLHLPIPVPTTRYATFGEFWAARLEVMAERAEDTLVPSQVRAVHDAIDVVAAGAFDGICGGAPETPARVHGDLWSGNVMWARSPDVTNGGDAAGGHADGTLIDPAAHGGHRLEDLALLGLFGAPHLGEITAGYEEAHPLPEAWRDDLPAHTLAALLAHVYLFGGTYSQPTEAAALEVVARARALGAL